MNSPSGVVGTERVFYQGKPFLKNETKTVQVWAGGGVQPIWATPVFRPGFFKGFPKGATLPSIATVTVPNWITLNAWNVKLPGNCRTYVVMFPNWALGIRSPWHFKMLQKLLEHGEWIWLTLSLSCIRHKDFLALSRSRYPPLDCETGWRALVKSCSPNNGF